MGREEALVHPMEQINHISERNFIYIVKAFAIFSIVSAHVGTVNEGTFLCNKIFGLLLDSFGSIGVGIFYFVSGYLFYGTKKTLFAFIKGKIKTILIPWVFCGTLLFLYITLRKGGLDFYHWISMITVHSQYYYLTVLMILYFLFWRSRNNMGLQLFITCVSVISITLTGLGLLSSIYPYSNPMNWAVYFLTGIMVGRYQLLSRLISFSKKYFPVSVILYLLILIFYLMNGEAIHYWKYAAIPAEITAFLLVLGASTLLLKYKRISRGLIFLGKISFSVYLLHAPFAGIITNLFNRFELWFLTPSRPFLVIGITILGIQLVRYVSKKIGVNKIVEILIGYR